MNRWTSILFLMISGWLSAAPVGQGSNSGLISKEGASGGRAASDGKHLMDHYFTRKPETFLVDPHHVLSGLEAGERERFLQYHASDSEVDLYVLIFRVDQELPDSGSVHEFMERFLEQGKPYVLAIFAYGAPGRSELYLSRRVAGVVTDAEKRRSLDSAILAAEEMNDSVGQLEAFLVQVSIRVYWMERALGLVDRDVAIMPGNGDAPKMLLESPEVGLADRLEPWMKEMDRWSRGFSIGCVSLLLFSLGWMWRMRRASHEFPDLGVEPRLGGRHGAGVGALISYANPSIPPAAQMDPGPDVLRRL